MNVADSLNVIEKGSKRGVSFWIWIVFFIILFLVITTIKKILKAKKEKEIEREREQTIKKIRAKLDDQFSLFKEEMKKRRLYDFYSRQLDVKEYQKKYKYNMGVKKQLFDFDFTYNEIEIARGILQEKLKEIFKSKKFTVNSLEYEMFLYDYYELIANREVLNQLKDKTENKEKWNKYYNENEKEIENLIIKNSE